ncbi:hypothetical protein [Dictyobacter aurantiacus]|uniref:Uncharacterized protein n=1 Tax=Dictyobacter aurantiacus TaxID=1936993 RepID=A0A401ZK38_9CHLR|nr:hypothetical protein [Dictyobacter aurantiacus]GCE07198.1 hypothetical protein KDAU_45270 [Dictyobacter aurantiacus]
MKTDRFYLEQVLEEAEQAGQEGTYPSSNPAWRMPPCWRTACWLIT